MSGVLDLTFMDVKESTGTFISLLSFSFSSSYIFFFFFEDLIQCLTEIITPNEGTESPSKKKKVSIQINLKFHSLFHLLGSMESS